jgi:hypothetical protein
VRERKGKRRREKGGKIKRKERKKVRGLVCGIVFLLMLFFLNSSNFRISSLYLGSIPKGVSSQKYIKKITIVK